MCPKCSPSVQWNAFFHGHSEVLKLQGEVELNGVTSHVNNIYVLIFI